MNASGETNNGAFDLIPGGVISFSLDGSITLVNKTILNWLGYSREELIGRKFEYVLTLGSKIFYQTHLFPLVKIQGRAEEINIALQSQDGKTLPVLLNAVLNEFNLKAGITCSMLKIEERKKFESELILAKRAAEQATADNEVLKKIRSELELHQTELDHKLWMLRKKNSELSQLNGILSHELQEAFRKIALFSDFVSDDPASMITPDSFDYLAKIKQSVSFVRSLMDHLQQYINIVEGEFIKGVVDLNKVIEDVKEEKKELIKESGAKISLTGLPSIEGDCNQLKKLFANIIDNSLKYRKENTSPEIHISGTIIAHNRFKELKHKYSYVEYVRISIKDNGIGFEQKYSDKIFLLMKRLHAKDKYSGVGIGLAMCNKIVELHHGEVSARSRTGEGTEIIILLPLKQEFPNFNQLG